MQLIEVLIGYICSTEPNMTCVHIYLPFYIFLIDSPEVKMKEAILLHLEMAFLLKYLHSNVGMTVIGCVQEVYGYVYRHPSIQELFNRQLPSDFAIQEIPDYDTRWVFPDSAPHSRNKRKRRGAYLNTPCEVFCYYKHKFILQWIATATKMLFFSVSP